KIPVLTGCGRNTLITSANNPENDCAELLAGVSDRCPGAPVGGGQPRAGFCGHAAPGTDPVPAQCLTDRHGNWHRHSAACGLFAAGYRADYPAVGDAVYCAEGDWCRLSAVYRLALPAGQTRWHSCAG